MIVLPEANFFLTFPSSLSTVVCSSSLFLQFLIFEMKTYTRYFCQRRLSYVQFWNLHCLPSVGFVRPLSSHRWSHEKLFLNEENLLDLREFQVFSWVSKGANEMASCLCKIQLISFRHPQECNYLVNQDTRYHWCLGELDSWVLSMKENCAFPKTKVFTWKAETQ